MRSTGGLLIVGHFDIVDIFMVSWDAIDNIGGEATSDFDEQLIIILLGIS